MINISSNTKATPDLRRKRAQVCTTDIQRLNDMSAESKALARKIAAMVTVNESPAAIFLTSDEDYLLKQAHNLQ